MTRFAVALWLAVLSNAAGADRITEMPRPELCVYTTRLSVAGYHHYLQGRLRADVRIHWKGDETQNEMNYVTRVIDQAYARAEADRSDARDRPMSEQDFGDEVYAECMTE